MQFRNISLMFNFEILIKIGTTGKLSKQLEKTRTLKKIKQF